MKTFNYLLILFLFVTSANAATIITTDSVYCANNTITFTGNSAGAVAYSWNFGDHIDYYSGSTNTKMHTYSSSGTFIVTMIATDATQNKDTAVSIIRIKPNVSAAFNLDQYNQNNQFCISTEFSISNWSNIRGFDSLHWNFGDGATSSAKSPHHIYSAPGFYTMKLTAYGFCGIRSDSLQVEVVADKRGKPETSLYVGQQTICPETEVSISAYFGSDAPDSMRIFTGDGNSTLKQAFDYYYKYKGMYEIKAISYNRCGSDTSKMMLTVTDSFDHQSYIYNSNPSGLCKGQKANLSFSGLGIEEIKIDFGDGDDESLENGQFYISHAYENNGSYNLTAIFQYFCGEPDTLYEQIVIGVSGIVYPYSISTSKIDACVNEEININLPYIQEGDTLDVNFGDGTKAKLVDNANSLSHKYAAVGSYKINTKKTNACGNSDSAFVKQNVGTTSSNTLSITANYQNNELLNCINDTVTIVMRGNGANLINGGNGAKLTNERFYFWDGSTSNGNEILKTFANPGSYRVLATATDVCGTLLKAAYTVDITNHTMLPAVRYWFQPLAQCVNDQFFFDNLTSNASKLVWNFGDGTIEEQPTYLPHMSHTYKKAGMYNVTLTATNGCGQASGTSVSRVIAAPTLDFTLSKNNINKGEKITFTNNTLAKSGTYWVFNLDENDTTSATTFERTFNDVGTFMVTVVAFNEFGCWDSLSKYFTVGNTNVYDRNGSLQLTLYPNPAQDQLHVQFDQAFKEASISLQILDLNGKILIDQLLESQNKDIRINISTIQNGTYLLRMNNGKEMMHAKFIVIH